MTPAEIAQTRRMLRIATRDYVHYSMKARSYEQRQLDIPPGVRMAIVDCQSTIDRLQAELCAAGVEVEN